MPGWGTTAEDRRALERLPNVRLLPNARNHRRRAARTRVLLMPSLWYEGFGLIVMESMLRGIPVVASDSGGLKEAKRGTGYVIPVRTIERYQAVFDEHAMPQPGGAGERRGAVDGGAVRAARRIAPPTSANRQPRAPRPDASWPAWMRAGLERYLCVAHPRAGTGAARRAARTIESLSPEKRALLLQRLHQRRPVALMRILLAQNSLYYPGARRRRQIQPPADGGPGGARARVPRGGAHQRLRRARSTTRYLDELARAACTAAALHGGGVVVFERNGVGVHVVTNAAPARLSSPPRWKSSART